MIFARKIARAKWEKASEECSSLENIDNFPADTLTADLRTKDNTLSIWHVANTDEAVLAMMATENASLETIHILYINEIENLPIVDFDGDTYVEDLVKQHKNIHSLNYKSIGTLAKIFLSAYKNNQYKTYKASEIKQILHSAITNKRIDVGKFNSSIRAKL